MVLGLICKCEVMVDNPRVQIAKKMHKDCKCVINKAHIGMFSQEISRKDNLGTPIMNQITDHVSPQ